MKMWSDTWRLAAMYFNIRPSKAVHVLHGSPAVKATRIELAQADFHNLS